MYNSMERKWRNYVKEGKGEYNCAMFRYEDCPYCYKFGTKGRGYADHHSVKCSYCPLYRRLCSGNSHREYGLVNQFYQHGEDFHPKRLEVARKVLKRILRDRPIYFPETIKRKD